MNAQRKRSATARVLRRQKVAVLYLQKLPQHEIGRRLGVGQATVHRDLRAVQKVWLESTLRNFDAARAEELAKIDNLEREYWEAWERSKLDKQSKLAEKSVQGKRTQLKTEGQVGNPRYLEGVQWCILKRCKLFGIMSDDTALVFNMQQNQAALGEQVQAMHASILPPHMMAKQLLEKPHDNGNGNGKLVPP